jgi:ribose transport system ATP-binding protein
VHDWGRTWGREGGKLLEPLLTIEHLSKVFPGQVALDDVHLTIMAGTTHALVGQNGSGKSTLIKILAGYHEPTGESTATMHRTDGDHILHLGDGRAAEHAGIRFVHQDLGLVDSVSSVENLSLGGGYATKFGRIHWKEEAARAHAELASLGFDDFDVRAPVGSLAPSQKTAVAVARALRGWEHGATLLVLDEPTASLPGADVKRLFEAIRRLKERGVAILYVSHHLDEVFEIADEVTVLRDGKNIATVPIGELDHERLIELMVGHVVERKRSTVAVDRGDVLLHLDGVVGGNIQSIDIQVHAGEVVGIAGITGSGRESVIPLVTGQMPSADGYVRIGATDVAPYAPRQAVKAGMAFVSADRARLGNFALLSVVANTTICDLSPNVTAGRLLHDKESDEASEWATKLSTKTAGVGVAIATLSGGNQQKVLFARGLRLQPDVIALDEPTRGIDVGAKEEIHSLIDQAATAGAAVLVASTDTEELVRVSRRVLIMRGGVIAAELTGDQITVENIERAQLQQKVAAP